MKIRIVGAKFGHADEQTRMTKLTVAFRSFLKALQKTKPLAQITAVAATYQ